MFWWNSSAAAHHIRKHNVSILDASIYAALLSMVIIWHLNVPTLLPYTYKFIMTAIKKYLDAQVAPAALTIAVYCPLAWLIFVNNFIFFMGTVWAMTLYKKPLSTSIKHTLAIIWPVIWRLIVLSLIGFFVALFLIGGYFAFKLLELSKEPGPQGPSFLRPLKYVFKLVGSYDTIKEFWAKIFRLPKAEILFKQINEWSLFLWYIVHALSTATTIWAVITVRQRLKEIE